MKSIVLTNEALRIAATGRINVVLLCDTGSSTPPRMRKFLWNLQTFWGLRGTKIAIPESNDINHPSFIHYLKNTVKPDFAFSFGSDQVFSPELLAVFKSALNNHNGLLPKYSGWLVTSWALYHKEKETGYCYHYMTEKVDRGPILLSESIPINHRSLRELKADKCKQASLTLQKVIIDFLNEVKGRPQEGNRTYYSKRALSKLCTVDRPVEHTLNELRHRMNSFGFLRIRINNQYVRATILETTTRSNASNLFKTADGQLVVPKNRRIIHRLLRSIRWLLFVYRIRFRLEKSEDILLS